MRLTKDGQIISSQIEYDNFILIEAKLELLISLIEFEVETPVNHDELLAIKNLNSRMFQMRLEHDKKRLNR